MQALAYVIGSESLTVVPYVRGDGSHCSPHLLYQIHLTVTAFITLGTMTVSTFMLQVHAGH